MMVRKGLVVFLLTLCLGAFQYYNNDGNINRGNSSPINYDGGISPVECKIIVAVIPDASKEWLEGLKERIKLAAEKVWECTEGQMCISEATITDKSKEGDIIIANLDDKKYNKEKWGYTSKKDRRIYLGGKFPTVTFCHEWGHAKFALPEEYDEPQCKECIMNPWASKFQFCDKDNHHKERKDANCWSHILEQYNKWKHPNKYGKTPEIKITVKDK